MIIELYNDDEFMSRLELIFRVYFFGVYLVSMDVLLKMFPDTTPLIYLAVKHLLYFPPLAGSDALKAFTTHTPLWDLKCHNDDHSCVSYDLDKAFEFRDNSYRNSNCFRSCYWQPLVQTLWANGEVDVSNKTFEFIPWKLRPIVICWSYKGDG